MLLKICNSLLTLMTLNDEASKGTMYFNLLWFLDYSQLNEPFCYNMQMNHALIWILENQPNNLRKKHTVYYIVVGPPSHFAPPDYKITADSIMAVSSEQEGNVVLFVTCFHLASCA